jgi:hypothetical protein
MVHHYTIDGQQLGITSRYDITDPMRHVQICSPRGMDRVLMAEPGLEQILCFNLVTEAQFNRIDLGDCPPSERRYLSDLGCAPDGTVYMALHPACSREAVPNMRDVYNRPMGRFNQALGNDQWVSHITACGDTLIGVAENTLIAYPPAKPETGEAGLQFPVLEPRVIGELEVPRGGNYEIADIASDGNMCAVLWSDKNYANNHKAPDKVVIYDIDGNTLSEICVGFVFPGDKATAVQLRGSECFVVAGDEVRVFNASAGNLQFKPLDIIWDKELHPVTMGIVDNRLVIASETYRDGADDSPLNIWVYEV